MPLQPLISDPNAPSMANLPPMGGLPQLGAPPLMPLVQNPRMQQEQGLQNRINSYENPQKPQGFWQNVRHIAATIGNDVGNVLAPGEMSLIPGTQFHNALENKGNVRELAGLQNQDTAESTAASENNLRGAQTGHLAEETNEMPSTQASELSLRGQQTREEGDEADALENPKPSYEIHDTPNGPLFVNKATGQAQHLTVDGNPVGPKIATKTVQLEIGGKPHQVLVNDADGTVIKDLGMSGEKPQVTNVNEGTWSLQNDTSGKPILFNSKTGQTKDAPSNLARKPNAEETKRADLAQNVNENLNALEDIVNRRPDLFGPVAGRLTKARETVGTSDPDVSTLKTLEDNLGMAMQSAHGMRSAQHVETSAQSVLNGFKNSPEALKAAIKAARNSVGTFQNNVQDTNDAGQPAAPAGADNEVYVGSKLVGHTVGGKYIALGGK